MFEKTAAANWRFLLRTAVSVVIVALGFHIYRAQYCERLLRRIDMLALSPPPNVSELEWAAIVFWTHNLHCNCLPRPCAEWRGLNGYLIYAGLFCLTRGRRLGEPANQLCLQPTSICFRNQVYGVPSVL